MSTRTDSHSVSRHERRSRSDTRVTQVARPGLAHAEIRKIVIGLMLAMFLGALDQTIVATALPTIGRQFGALENLSWVVTAYLLTSAAVVPLYGKLADIYGRRTMLLVGIGLFVAGSVACAAAPSMTFLILGRALQGLGGGGILPLSQIITGDIVAPKERGRYQGYFGVVFATASIGGPLLGGVIAEHLHWSLIFWINVPLGAIAFVIGSSVLKRLPRHERPHRLDLLGALLMIGASVSFLLALTWGGVRYPWGSMPVLLLFAGSALLWVAFGVRIWAAREPFLPAALLTEPVVRRGAVSAGAAMGTVIGLTMFTPLYFETVLGYSASQSGLALIPFMAASALAATLTGRVMGNIRHYKRIPMVGVAVAIAALASLAWWPSGMPLAVVLLLLFGIGLGLGAVFPVTTVSVQNVVPPHQLGTATGLLNLCRALASAMIVAVFGAIALSGGAATGHETAAIADPARVFGWVFAAGAGFVGLSALALALMAERPLRTTIAPATSDAPVPAATPAE